MSQEPEPTAAELYYAMHVAPHTMSHDMRQALEQHILNEHTGLDGYDYIREVNKHIFSIATGRLKLILTPDHI